MWAEAPGGQAGLLCLRVSVYSPLQTYSATCSPSSRNHAVLPSLPQDCMRAASPPCMALLTELAVDTLDLSDNKRLDDGSMQARCVLWELSLQWLPLFAVGHAVLAGASCWIASAFCPVQPLRSTMLTAGASTDGFFPSCCCTNTAGPEPRTPPALPGHQLLPQGVGPGPACPDALRHAAEPVRRPVPAAQRHRAGRPAAPPAAAARCAACGRPAPAGPSAGVLNWFIGHPLPFVHQPRSNKHHRVQSGHLFRWSQPKPD